VRAQGQIPPKTLRSRPVDTVLDGLLGSRCGAKTSSQSHGAIRVEPAVQRACGRTGGAEQSTIARTWQASPAATVAQLRRGSWDSLKRSGQPPPHRCAERLLGGEVEVTPLPIGAHAEGRDRPGMGRTRRKTGRKVWRGTARASRELLHEPWLRGKASAGGALHTARSALEPRRGWTRERRQRLVLRLEGGFGPPEGLQGLRSRDSQIGAKISHRGRGRKWRQALGPWPPPSSPGRESAAVLRPHRFWRTTRQWMMRPPKEKGGYQSAGLATTLVDHEPVALADAYAGRAMLAAPCCQDKQALGLVPRRPRRWEAQQMVLLLARLAHPLLLWGTQWLSRVPTTRRRVQGYGLVRVLRDVWAIPGGIRWRRGWMGSVRFSPLPPLATPLQESFAALFRGRVRGGILR
jgi:hypothetical protein